MIPKIIHYCWFGRGKLPPIALKCIESWKKYLPEYKIIKWSEENFDVNMISYTAEAYRQKKFAFVSDFVRLYVVYRYGGIYFDTDVEVIRPIDDILQKGTFLGVEKKINTIDGMFVDGINPGLGFAAVPNNPFFYELINIYSKERFVNGNGSSYGYKTIVDICTEAMIKHGYNGFASDEPVAKILHCYGVNIYSKHFFCPDFNQNKWDLMPDTRTIHHYCASWLPVSYRIKISIVRFLPSKLYSLYLSVKERIKR